MGVIFSKVRRKDKRNSFRLSRAFSDQMPDTLPTPCAGYHDDCDTIPVHRKSIGESHENRKVDQLEKFDNVQFQSNDAVQTSHITSTSYDSGVSNFSAATRESVAMLLHRRRQSLSKDLMHPVQYMVDVFKRMVCKCLRPSDVLSNLLFIDSTTVEKIRNKEKESAFEASEMMIEHIQRSADPGKWQALVDALSKAEYKYLAKLLTGETEIDPFINMEILCLNFDELINQIQIGECLESLYENEVINVRDKEVIEAELKCAGPIAAARKLLENMHRQYEHWDEKFYYVLEKCGMRELVDIFQKAACAQVKIQDETILELKKPTDCEFNHSQHCTKDEDDEIYVKAVSDSQKPDNAEVIQILEKVTMLETEVAGLKTCMEKQYL